MLEVGTAEIRPRKARAIEHAIGKGGICEICMDKVDGAVGAHAQISVT